MDYVKDDVARKHVSSAMMSNREIRKNNTLAEMKWKSLWIKFTFKNKEDGNILNYIGYFFQISMPSNRH